MTHAVSRRLTEKKISTHTPARGVTLPGTHRNWPDPVFQPTLPRGEWLVWNALPIASTEFQPTLPQGEWPDNIFQCVCLVPDFNPHSRKGSDCRVILIRKELNYISTHTPARGVTTYFYFGLCISPYFNPHSRKGSDGKESYYYTIAQISTHTPARGVTG